MAVSQLWYVLQYVVIALEALEETVLITIIGSCSTSGKISDAGNRKKLR